jgi:hypothetical protein
MGATKERRMELKAERHLKWLQNYTVSNKYLADPKYYKNNYWSWAAWDSWAAKGKVGSCPCGCGHYNATLCNTRSKTARGGREDVCKNVSVHLCSECVFKIEKIVNHKFERH